MIDDKNQLLVSTDGDMIYVICKTERQQEMVVKRNISIDIAKITKKPTIRYFTYIPKPCW